MTAITSLLDDMASFTKGGPDFLGDGKVFSLDSHPLKPDGMAALPEFCQFLLVALPAFLGKDHGFLFGRKLMVNVTGHAMDTFFRMLRFNP